MRVSRLVSYRAVIVVVLIAALAGATPARAGFQLLTDSADSNLSAFQTALQANDSASWSGFDVNNPTVVSANGINVSVQFYLDSQQIGLTTVGRYPGTPVLQDLGLTNNLNNGSPSIASLTLTFSQPVSAVGSLMDSLDTTLSTGSSLTSGAFQITAFDSNGNKQTFGSVLGTADIGFVGIVSDSGNITQLTFTDSANGGVSTRAWVYLIGNLELRDSPQVSSVPAPSGLTLACLGALGLIGCRCWRRCRTAIA